MTSPPLISILIATRNAARELPRCLDSIRAQSFRGMEVLVADGASGDGTLDVIEAYGDVVTAWDSRPDTGIFAAHNRSLRRATGDWVFFLGADDWIPDPSALETMAPHLRGAFPRYRVVYGRVQLIDRDGRLVEELGEPWERCRDDFRSCYCLAHQGVFHHRSLFEEHGLFDEKLKMTGDYELLLRELKNKDALFVPVLTAAMGFGGLTTDLSHAYRLLEETRTALAMHGLAPPRLRWAYLMFTAWCYLKIQRVIGDTAARRLADAYRLLTFRRPRYSGRG